MIIQHNISSINTNRQLGISTANLAKSTEKLSSGYRINRAADDAAGLAISEKMRSQIRGLGRASDNASDGISMIQTAEGALSETHSILQRMRELSVQAANGTETDSDRSNLQDEIEQLQEEVDRISSDTEFNTMPLLDGTLSSTGSSSSYSSIMTPSGPKFGFYDTTLRAFVTSNIAEVKVAANTLAEKGSESAIWSADGKTLTLNLSYNATYNQVQIDNLIKNARQEDSTATNTPANIKVSLKFGSYTSATDYLGDTTGTIAGSKADSTSFMATYTANGENRLCPFVLYATRYGEDMKTVEFEVQFDSPDMVANTYHKKEGVYLKTPASYNPDGSIRTGAVYYLTLYAPHDYTEKDLTKMFEAAGLPIEVKALFNPAPEKEEPTINLMGGGVFTSRMTLSYGGAGLGDDDAFVGEANYDFKASSGDGLILQVGANEGQTMRFSIDDMSASALGIDAGNVDLSTQGGAQRSIAKLDDAIQKVSKQRALLGAVQNRLEHTISNLDNTAENLQSAESTIRDADMAEEMVQFSKNNILNSAGQSMLAQANNTTQGVLQLLQ